MYTTLAHKPVFLLVVAGSRAYGIHTETSDVDVKGVCFGDAASYTGFLTRFEQHEDQSLIEQMVYDSFAHLSPEKVALWAGPVKEHGVEGTVYELRKFMKLASDCNPNVLEVLFGNDDHVLFQNDIGRRLREMRGHFLSAKAKHTFCGYANSQLSRIKSHRLWILSPDPNKPTREQFGLPERTLIPKDQLAAVRAAVQKKLDQWELDLGDLDLARRIQIRGKLEEALLGVMSTTDDMWIHASRTIGLSEALIEVLAQERKYDQAMKRYKSYKTWEKNRNEQRAEWERLYGYDIKHGAHLYRLLAMGREILTTGEVHVDRTGIDAEYIRSIRRGEVSYEELVEWAEVADTEIRELYDDMYKRKTKTPVLPKTPDRKALNSLCCELVRDYLTMS